MRKPQWAQRSPPGFFLDWRSQWAGASAETMTLLDYINEQKAFAYVAAAAWLFCPETIEHRDCIFLKDRFNQENVDTWFEQLDGEPMLRPWLTRRDCMTFSRVRSLTVMTMISQRSPWPWVNAGRECWQPGTRGGESRLRLAARKTDPMALQ